MCAKSAPLPLKPVTERKKRSCSECRRRKQKCDQRHPCRNCARRMPQPVCHYEGSPLREQAVADLLPRLTLDAAPASTNTPFPTAPAPRPAAGTPGHLDLDRPPWTEPSPSSWTTDSTFEEAHSVWTASEPRQRKSPLRLCQSADHQPNNPVPLYTDAFLPCLSHDATASPASLFSEAWQPGAKTIPDRDASLAARCASIQILHSMMATPETATSDEAIEAVIRLVLSDLCYGEAGDLRVHVDGVHEMVRLRGGLQGLGREGMLAKVVVLADLLTALTLDVRPSFSDRELSEVTGNVLLRCGNPHSPAIPNRPATPSQPHPLTAAMLKDIDFLIDTVLALPDSPSAWQLQKIQSMSTWVHGRLTGATSEGPTSSADKHLHRAVRLASLVCCRAIQSRQRFSVMMEEKDVIELTHAITEVPLGTWNTTLGTLVLLLAVTLPAAKNSVPCYPTRLMVITAAVQLALTDWSAVAKTLGRVVKLQDWLRGISLA